MALKDWKKQTDKLYWKYIGKNKISNDNTISIKIYKDLKWNINNPYHVYVVGFPPYNSGIEGSFKSESQALKYAKAYMKKY